MRSQSEINQLIILVILYSSHIWNAFIRNNIVTVASGTSGKHAWLVLNGDSWGFGSSSEHFCRNRFEKLTRIVASNHCLDRLWTFIHVVLSIGHIDGEIWYVPGLTEKFNKVSSKSIISDIILWSHANLFREFKTFVK